MAFHDYGAPFTPQSSSIPDTSPKILTSTVNFTQKIFQHRSLAFLWEPYFSLKITSDDLWVYLLPDIRFLSGSQFRLAPFSFLINQLVFLAVQFLPEFIIKLSTRTMTTRNPPQHRKPIIAQGRSCLKISSPCVMKM